MDNNFVIANLEILGDLSIKFAEVGKTCGSHPHDEMLIGHVNPLNLIPILSNSIDKCTVCEIFELIIDVTLPCNSFFVDWDVSTGRTLKLIGVGENTLSNEAARHCGKFFLTISEGLFCLIEAVNLRGQVLVLDDRITFSQFVSCEIVALELRERS